MFVVTDDSTNRTLGVVAGGIIRHPRTTAKGRSNERGHSYEGKNVKTKTHRRPEILHPQSWINIPRHPT